MVTSHKSEKGSKHSVFTSPFGNICPFIGAVVAIGTAGLTDSSSWIAIGVEAAAIALVTVAILLEEVAILSVKVIVILCCFQR